MRSSTDFYFLILRSFKLVIEVSLQVTDDRTPVNRQIVFSVIDHLLFITIFHFEGRIKGASKDVLTRQRKVF